MTEEKKQSHAEKMKSMEEKKKLVASEIHIVSS